MNNKRLLLCTFSTFKDYNKIISEIKNLYTINENRFFVFTNEESPTNVFVTYNVYGNSQTLKKFPNTVSIHRKKESNTLYTLNALNQLIRESNNNVEDKSFSINWMLYENSIIITGNPTTRIIPIKMLEIIIAK